MGEGEMSLKREELAEVYVDLDEIPEVGGKASLGQDIASTFPGKKTVLGHFHEIWGGIEENLDLSLTSEEALRLMPSLVVYDIPDGTRSTLTVRPDIDVGVDAALYCLALVHTLRHVGARNCILMTHTMYNRGRGREGTNRILKILSEGIKPFASYARREGVGVHLVGMGEDYELRSRLTNLLPEYPSSGFNAYFLVDYTENGNDNSQTAAQLKALPDVDVCVRHTKLNLSGGGWIPDKLLKSTFMYCQNGTLFSNWTFDELVALATLSLVAKLMHTGEGLVKMYGDIDEVKARHQLRELRLFNKRVLLRSRPTKLFVFGSPQGLYQFYY